MCQFTTPFYCQLHFTQQFFFSIQSPILRCFYLFIRQIQGVSTYVTVVCLNRRLYRTNKSDLPINNAFMFELINQYLCTKSIYRNHHQPLRTLKSGMTSCGYPIYYLIIKKKTLHNLENDVQQSNIQTQCIGV